MFSKKVILTLLAIAVIALLFLFCPRQEDARHLLLRDNLFNNRSEIAVYKEIFGKFPSLKEKNRVNFWEIQGNQYVWQNDFEGIENITIDPRAQQKRESRFFLVASDGQRRKMSLSEIESRFVNPISGKFDWLAEDTSGALYSANMPDSVLLASPPIQVVNIRCPLTASDPPCFEDFTKW